MRDRRARAFAQPIGTIARLRIGRPVRRIVGLLAGLALTVGVAAGRPDGAEEGGDSADSVPSRTAVIELRGPIDGEFLAHFRAKLGQARRTGCTLVVLDLDSPGGLVEESLEIGRLLGKIDWATTVVWVPKQALSGAALLSLGADRIVLGPDGRIGDAGVIHLDEAWLFRYVEAKVLSDVVRQVRDLATANGHSPELAEAMVDRHAVVYRRPRADGSQEYLIVYAQDDVPERAIAPPPPAIDADEAPWTLIDESIGNRFLTVNATQGVAIGLVARQDADLAELLRQENGEANPIVLRRTFADQVAFWLTRPLIRLVLIVIGLVALYFELASPGIGAGGILSGLCFVAIFWSSFMSGLAGTLELVLFLSAVVLLGLELFVIPGFGIAGLLGLTMLVASLILAGQSFLVPSSAIEWNELTTSFAVTAGAAVGFLGIAGAISRRLGSIPILNRLVLALPSESSGDDGHVDGAGKKHPTLQVGEWGEAEMPLRPGGKARFASGTFDVVAEDGWVEAGRPLRIVEIVGHRIIVQADEGAG